MIRSFHTFNFGKYRGQSVDTVARRDPGYIYFCENEMDLRFSDKVKRTARRSHFRPTRCGRPLFL